MSTDAEATATTSSTKTKMPSPAASANMSSERRTPSKPLIDAVAMAVDQEVARATASIRRDLRALRGENEALREQLHQAQERIRRATDARSRYMADMYDVEGPAALNMDVFWPESPVQELVEDLQLPDAPLLVESTPERRNKTLDLSVQDNERSTERDKTPSSAQPLAESTPVRRNNSLGLFVQDDESSTEKDNAPSSAVSPTPAPKVTKRPIVIDEDGADEDPAAPVKRIKETKQLGSIVAEKSRSSSYSAISEPSAPAEAVKTRPRNITPKSGSGEGTSRQTFVSAKKQNVAPARTNEGTM